MRIGVTGHRGRLGRALVNAGCLPLNGDIRGHLIVEEIKKHCPDVIIHCAAMTDVDGCEVAPMEAASINTFGTKALLTRFGGKLVYISTDYIFDGLVGPYTEDAYPNPLGMYGWSKLGGEIAVRAAGPENLIIRTTLLFDKTSPNFVTTVAGKLRAGERIFLPETLYGSPTYIPALVAGILEAVRQGVSGTLNIVGRGVVSRYELGREIAQALGVDEALVTASQLVPGLARRPLRAGLRVEKANSLGIPIYDYRDSVQEVVHALETMADG